jgi:predicted MFS family arabinose efflux permease
VIALQVVVGAGFALAAAAAARLELLGLALLVPGAAIGVLFTTTYLVADRLSHEGTGTQTFAWLVTANNGGIGFGAAVAGVLSEASGAATGLWFGAVCGLVGAIPAAAAAALSAHGPKPPQNGGSAGVTSGKRRINAPQGNGEPGEGR